MTATTERVLQDIRSLPVHELRVVWQEVNGLLNQGLCPNPHRPTTKDFETTLATLTGATAEKPLLPRLLRDRAQERARERAQDAKRSPRRHNS